MENSKYNDIENNKEENNNDLRRTIQPLNFRASMGFTKETQFKPLNSIESLNPDRKSIAECLRGSHNTFIPNNTLATSSEEESSDYNTDSESSDECEDITVKAIKTDKYKYIGEVRNGRKDGFGVCYYTNGDKYIGQWQNDLKCGLGKLTLNNGKTFSGEFVNNSVDGFVEYINNQGVMHHGLMRGCRFIPGEPLIMKNSKCIFQGKMKYSDGKLNGVGTFNYSNGGKYEGEICDYAENGLGIFYKPDGYIFKGYNKERVFNGLCEVTSPDKALHFAYYKNNVKNGLSITISPEGIYSVGIYSDDTINGGSLILAKECTKFEIWLYGFCVKTIEKKENIINYVNTVYPEYKYLLRIKNSTIWNIFKQ
jgi:hypothetical protein